MTAAIAATPGKSDRAIAEEIGVGSNTVRRAMQKAVALDGAAEKRIGRDGKSYSPRVADPIALIRLRFLPGLSTERLNSPTVAMA